MDISEIDKWVSERVKEARFKSELSSFRSLCLRPYWTRLWIVQEVISCKVTPLCIRLRNLDFIMLVLIMTATLGMDEVIATPLELTDWIPRSFIFVRIGVRNMEYMEYSSCQLGNVLLDFRSQRCLDPRDKIYGLMGIAFSNADLPLQADYSMTVDEIYKLAAKYNMNNNRSLDLICNEERYLCRCIQSQHLLSDLLSWVTDWTCLVGPKL
jgi:hypothetical protein